MKKFLLFIVEGNNDKKEIQTILRTICGQRFFENYYDAFYVHGGDIFTEKDSSEKTISGKLNNIVLRWRNGGADPNFKIVPADVLKIIHIIDTDGVYVPESALIQSDEGKIKYYDRTVEYYDREFLVGRNRKKAKLVNKLLETKRIDNIPYEMYFASCNMDHLLFNLPNSLPKDKGANASYFTLKCKDKEYLRTSILADGIKAEGTYMDSWDMIRKDYNSLARHTNLNLLLTSIVSELNN